MELRQLRYLVALAEDLHFGKAAARLNIAQPALTQQIKALEADFGTRLFLRTKRSVALTSAGALIVAEARRVLSEADRAHAVALQAGRGELGVVEIGFVGSATFSGVLSDSIFAFRQHFPQVDLRLHEKSIAQQVRDIDEQRLDVAFVRSPILECPPGLVIQTLTSERILLAIHQSHPLAQRHGLRVSDLADELFIVPSLHPGMGFYAHSEAVWKEGRFRPRVAQKAPQFSTICSLVAAGLGVALVPESVQRLQLENVRYLPLADVTRLSDLVIVYRRDESAPAVRSFLATVDRLFPRAAEPVRETSRA